MHVQCGSCESGYNIDDSKIPDNGAKVRCKSCQDTIILKKRINSIEMTAIETSAQPVKKIGNKITYGQKWLITVICFYAYSLFLSFVMNHLMAKNSAQNILFHLSFALGYIALAFICALILALLHLGLANKVFKRSVSFTKLGFTWYIWIAFIFHILALIGHLSELGFI